MTAALLIGAFFIFVFWLWTHGPKSATCEDAAELAVLAAPIAPWKGAPLRVLFATEKPIDGELSLIAPDGSVAAKSHERHGGPPYFWYRRNRLTCRRDLARDARLRRCDGLSARPRAKS